MKQSYLIWYVTYAIVSAIGVYGGECITMVWSQIFAALKPCYVNISYVRIIGSLIKFKECVSTSTILTLLYKAIIDN